MIKWDESAGIRERLNLVADLGVNVIGAMKEEDSPKYYGMTDHWRMPIVGGKNLDGSRRIKLVPNRRTVEQALHVVTSNGKISTSSAMEIIGFPVKMAVTQVSDIR